MKEYHGQSFLRLEEGQQVQSLVSVRLTFLISLDFGLDSVPVDFDVTRVLLETLVGLLFAVLLEEALTIGNNRVHVRFVVDSNL